MKTSAREAAVVLGVAPDTLSAPPEKKGVRQARPPLANTKLPIQTSERPPVSATVQCAGWEQDSNLGVDWLPRVAEK